MNNQEITPQDFTKNLLDIINSNYDNDDNLDMAKTLLKNNQKLLDFETFLKYNTSKFPVTLYFKKPVSKVCLFGSKKLVKLKGYFKYLQGHLCHLKASNSRYGTNLYSSDFAGFSIENIELMELELPMTKKEMAKDLLKKIHPNLWQCLRLELENFIEGKGAIPSILANNKTLRYKSISSTINDDKIQNRCTIKRINDTIINNGYYNWSNKSNHAFKGRDLSIEIRDGLGWFSSKFNGTLNGDEWLLINPTTIVYYLRD